MSISRSPAPSPVRAAREQEQGTSVRLSPLAASTDDDLFRPHRRAGVLLAVCLFTLLLSTLLAVVIGSVRIPPLAVGRLLLARPLGLSVADLPDTFATILFEIRLPRVALMAFTGAALAAAGATYQGLFRNPLADPYLVGVASGAGLGAVAGVMGTIPP